MKIKIYINTRYRNLVNVILSADRAESISYITWSADSAESSCHITWSADSAESPRALFSAFVADLSTLHWL